MTPTADADDEPTTTPMRLTKRPTRPSPKARHLTERTSPARPMTVAGLVRVRLDIAYDGTDFSGWAAQPGQRTVQGELEARLDHDPARTPSR